MKESQRKEEKKNVRKKWKVTEKQKGAKDKSIKKNQRQKEEKVKERAKRRVK